MDDTQKPGEKELMSDEAVKAKTGKGWEQWFAILDAADAPSRITHKQMADFLHSEQGVPGWWCQMVTVGYERAGGLRNLGERPDGYQISVSKTLNVPALVAFSAWTAG